VWRWTSAPRADAPPPPPGGWTPPKAPPADGEVVVIRGGKAEIISRKDPDDRS
jgi:hypothetical protein